MPCIMEFSPKLCQEYISDNVVLPSLLAVNGKGREIYKYSNSSPLGTHFCEFISLDFETIITTIKNEVAISRKNIKIPKNLKELEQLRDKGGYEKTYIKIMENLISQHIFLNELKDYIVNLFIEQTDNNDSEYYIGGIERLNLIKQYIDKSIDNPIFAQFDVFSLAYDMEYFEVNQDFPNASRIIKNHISEDNDVFDNILSMYNILNSKNDKGVIYRYYPRNFYDSVIISLIEVFKNGYIIKKCANCGKYFIPYNRSDSLYCTRTSPQDSGKNCKEYGAFKTYQDNLKNNECMSLYRKIYMQKQMLTKRNIDIKSYKDDFELYKTESKLWKLNVKKGLKSESEFLEWLRNIRKKESE